MVGVAFEVHDTDQRRRAIVKASEQTNKEEMTKLELESKYWDVNPTFLDVIFYGFCYIGILTGFSSVCFLCVNLSLYFQACVFLCDDHFYLTIYCKGFDYLNCIPFSCMQKSLVSYYFGS